MTSKLEGQVAVVTGAARGIGRASAHRLAELGAAVAVVSRNLRSYEEFEGERSQMTADNTAEEIKATGGRAIGIELDVGDPGDAEAMAKRVLDEWGRIDILVANAGGGSGVPATTLASELTPEHLDYVIRGNLKTTIYSCTAVAPAMKAQGSGKIVTTSSVGGSIARKDGGYAHYAAVKAAIVLYTRNLAQDLGPHNICVNCIAPGLTMTGRIAEQLAGHTPPGESTLPRAGRPEDIANVIEFLTTNLSDYVTGAVIPVDGGWNRGPS